MNKSSSLLLRLHLHLLHFLIMNKSSYFQKKKFKKKNQFSLNLLKQKQKTKIFKKKEGKIFKKGLGTRGIGLVLLRLFSKKKKKIINQNFQFLQKIQVFQSKKKKKKNKKTQKKKKQKSSLNSSSGTESYDPLPHSPVVQHQVNCPPLAFIKACNMSQTTGIRQLCQSLFNE